MFLLQLPFWSYVIVATIVVAVVAASLHVPGQRRASLDRRLSERRACAAAAILRVLNDEQVKRAVGANFR